MFMPTSVAMIPMKRPEDPVMTPAERSNSPPIISRATATAGMPSVDATSVQLAAPSSVPKSSVVKAKKSPITAAAIRAPSSGRRASFVSRLTSARRSSTTEVVGSTAVAWRVVPQALGSAECARIALSPAPAPRGSAGPLLRQLLDGVGVALVDEPRTGEHRQAAADRVRVLVKQGQEH